MDVFAAVPQVAIGKKTKKKKARHHRATAVTLSHHASMHSRISSDVTYENDFAISC